MTAVSHARVGADGRLREADGRFAEVNGAAGGAIGDPIALPQVATLTRLAGRLGVLVSRSVLVADASGDHDVWVRAVPEGDEVRLALGGWQPRPAWPVRDTPERRADLLRLGGDVGWEVDHRLRLARVTPTSVGGEPVVATIVPMLGRRLPALFCEEDADAIEERLERRRAFADVALTLRSGRSVRAAGEPRIDADGMFAGFVGTLLIDVQPDAPEATTLPAGLGDRLDHALKGALNRIVANADSISAQSEGPIRDDYADYASDIASAGRHLLSLIDDLVDLQALEEARFAVDVEPLDLADVARAAAGLLGVRAEAAGVVIVRPAGELRAPAQGDYRRCLQILVNIVGNAVRYAPRDSAIALDVATDDGGSSVTVTDEGPGIAPEDQARVFGKFERVDASEPGGSGLGLYIARRLAQAMGGDILLDSKPGRGASFTLTLPAR